MYFGVLAVGIVGALLARFQPHGMARALFAFIIGVQEPAATTGTSPLCARRLCFYKLYVSMALATLAKGLIGVWSN